LLAQAQSPSSASRKWWATWVSLFWIEVLLYFWGYEKPPNHPPMWWFIPHPLMAAEYVLLFFGGPFSRGTNLSPIPVGLSMGALAASILPLIFFTGAGALGGLPFWPMNRQLGAYRKTLVTFINAVTETDQLTELVFPWPGRVKTAVNVLNRIGYWRPPLIRS